MYLPCSDLPSITLRIPRIPPGRVICFDSKLDATGFSHSGLTSNLCVCLTDNNVRSAAMAVEGLTLIRQMTGYS